MKNFIILILILTTISCRKNEKETIISGNIPNLPNGTVYLFKDDPSNIIDSVKSKNGVFEISHKWNESEPAYIGINHIDNNGVLRLFSFTTNAKYRGVSGWGTSVFLSDSIITMNGNLTYNTFIDVQLPPKLKPVTGPKLILGKQTEAFYNIDGDLFEKINDNVVKTIKEKISTYPYSYHLLYKISENKNSFSALQIQDFLKSFKGEITHSESYKKLYVYNQKRFNEKNISLPLLEDNKGKKKEIIDRKYKKHLIVFWASWCSPCRKEIPILKKVYKDYSNEVEFISISIDEDKKSWQNALKTEMMDWKQFIIMKKNTSDFEALQIQFKLNQAIPYTILVDNNLRILSSSTGLSSQEELKKIISDH